MIYAKICSAAVLGAALLASTALADPAETAKAVGKDASWLFIQTAQSAKFDGTTLTLENVSPSVVMFTDRPARMAEAMPTTTFLTYWDQGGANNFQSNPPNAGLTSLIDGKLQTATVELTKPHLEGTTLTYQVQVIDGQLNKTGGTSSLFIDGGFDNSNPWNPHGGPH